MRSRQGISLETGRVFPLLYPDGAARRPCLRGETSDLYSVGFDLVVEGLATNAQSLCRFQLVATCFFKGLDDGIALYSFEQGEACVVALARAGFHGGDGQV